MKISNWYILQSLFVSTIFIALTLIAVVFLTQSLRFLELVMESGASGGAFWVLTILALPRFFEVILPLALMAAVIFTYNRLLSDSELVIFKAVGRSPLNMAGPALLLALILTIFLWFMSMYVAPKSLASMQHMRQVIKAQFSNILFREGVFNQVADGLTVYIRERASDGELQGLMIYDHRDKSQSPSTILATRGLLVSQDGKDQVLVYDGTRQDRNQKTGTLQRLDFKAYTIDLPDDGAVRNRWREPDERTLNELLNPNLNNIRDVDNLREFRIEIHRRVTGPMLAIVFTLIGCVALLLGPVQRRGQTWRIVSAVAFMVVAEGLFLASANFARKSDFGIALMYILVLFPMFGALFLLSRYGEGLRRQILYVRRSFS